MNLKNHTAQNEAPTTVPSAEQKRGKQSPKADGGTCLE